MLTPTQEKFLAEYVKGRSATRAYMQAYGTTNEDSAKSMASRLLRKPAVAKRLMELQAQVAGESICTAKEIQERLSAVARRELTETVYLPNGAQCQRPTSIKDSCRALELLAKIQGLFVTKQEIDLSGAMPVIIKDDL